MNRSERQIHRDAFPDPRARRARSKPRCFEGARESLRLEIDRHVANVRWRALLRHPLSLVSLRRRVIHLEDGDILQRFESPGSRVEPGAQNDELVDVGLQCGSEMRIDRLGPQHHVIDQPEGRRTYGSPVQPGDTSEVARRSSELGEHRGQKLGRKRVDLVRVHTQSAREGNQERRPTG